MQHHLNDPSSETNEHSVEGLSKVTLIYLTAFLPSAASIIYPTLLSWRARHQDSDINLAYLFVLINSGYLINGVNGGEVIVIPSPGVKHCSLFV